MLIYKPQDGTPLTEAVKVAIQISKALNKDALHAYVEIQFNDVAVGINELSSVENTLDTVYEQIAKKYHTAGEHHSFGIHKKDYWMNGRSCK